MEKQANKQSTMPLAETTERVIAIRFPKLEAKSIDEMIDKLTELKQETATNGNQVKRLFTIAVIDVGVK